MKTALVLLSLAILLVLGWNDSEQPSGRVAETLVVCYFGATDVGMCMTAENISRIRRIKADFAGRYKEYKVKHVMVCLDEDIGKGLKFIDRHGQWDEISVGAFFHNELAMLYLNKAEIPGLPHIQVYGDAYTTGKWHIPVIMRRSLLIDLAGEKEIQEWIEKGFPLERAPVSPVERSRQQWRRVLDEQGEAESNSTMNEKDDESKGGSQMNVKKLVLIVCGCALGLAALASAGGADRTVPAWGDPQSGLVLQYRMPAGRTLKYEASIGQSEIADVLGRTARSLTNGKSIYLFRSKGESKGDLLLETTIEAAALDMDVDGRKFSADMKPVLGRSFALTLSPLGKELDLSGAETIQFDLPGGKQNMAYRFQALFPDLPGRPVKVGDSWTTHDAIDITSAASKVTIDFENNHTIDGLEIVEGHECMRVKVKTRGRISGEGSQGGIAFTIKGELQGLGTWHFAYRKGMLVRQASESIADVIVELPAPQAMKIPTRQETKELLALVR